MTVRSQLMRVFQQEDINFLLTNRIPRQACTRFMGWLSRIEQPLVRDLSIGLWRQFADLNLGEAKKTRFSSLHDCFVRELKEGARPIDADPAILASPCDAIVGTCGAMEGTRAIQAKGFEYSLEELLGDALTINALRGGCYATLRITASMYHHFHAPYDCCVEHVTYFAGDTWNVNPIALKRVEKLFCKNERAAITVRLQAANASLVLVPVAAVLVASIKLNFLNQPLDLRYRGPNDIPCNATFNKGDRMGWFQHGSTILIFAPRGYTLCAGVGEGTRISVGEPLMRLP